jgi:23S rRNA pseudouridine1911/1915/1917 synthase
VPSSARPDGVRLDLRLIAAHPELSRRKAREVIEKGQVTVDGELCREPGVMTASTASIVWDVNREAMSRVRLSLPRLYEDETMIVVDKPAGLLSVPSAPGRHGEDTAQARVLDYVAKLHPHRPYVGAVHRLDRDTSGALAFALTRAVRQGLRDLFSRHAIVRRYLAIVRVDASGAPFVAAGQGVIDLPIHTEYVAGRRRLARPGEPSLEARTRYRVRERFHDAALLELELETGRQHQIRLHLAHAGMPVLGDRTYGPKPRSDRSAAPIRVPRQMLHARLLELTNPMTGDKVRAESPLPEDFESALADLKRRGGRSAAGPAPRRRV